MIRNADISDAKEIAGIYNEYILYSSCTFETEPLTVGEMASRIHNVTQQYPWLVFTENGSVLGYTYASMWKTRSAYCHTVEAGIYIRSGNLYKGVGTELLRELINQPNPPSITLFVIFGFTKVAHFREVGRTFDEWINVGYWQLVF